MDQKPKISVKRFTEGRYKGYCIRVLIESDDFIRADWFRPSDVMAVRPPQDILDALHLWHANNQFADMDPAEFVVRMYKDVT